MFKVSLFGRNCACTSVPTQEHPVEYSGKRLRFDSLYSHETGLFRDKLIENLPLYLKNKYPNGARIMCYGCSGGHEAYSIAAKFIEIFGSSEEAKKLFPIFAYDIQDKVISYANEGLIILPEDIGDWKTSYPFNKAFRDPQEIGSQDLSQASVFYPNRKSRLFSYTVGEELKGMVSFSQENVMDGVEKLDPKSDKPVIFMFRNSWFHLSFNERTRLAERLYSNLPNKSLIVNGDSDVEVEYPEGCTTPEALSMRGFTLLRDDEIKLHSPRWFNFNPFRGYLFEKIPH